MEKYYRALARKLKDGRERRAVLDAEANRRELSVRCAAEG